MGINDMVYRTKTYIAGDWTGDKDLIDKLDEWNNNDHLALSFVNVHEVIQSSDSTLNCNIKRSLRKRLKITKTFVLIVGEKTCSLRSGACYFCGHYNSGGGWYNCYSGGTIDNRSYIQYECEMALKDYNAGELKNI
ncbi:MAG: molecular chaperone Tir, partial [Candidatus Saccharibacteria bacterium]|nr:molecular chaperone Tir [Candidatus Saccharibacteria bacterium]